MIHENFDPELFQLSSKFPLKKEDFTVSSNFLENYPANKELFQQMF